jgi:hypothetical protein
VNVGLYLDHNVPEAVGLGLRQRGVDVATAYEDGSADLDDERLLDRAAELGRVLFTHDRHFLAIANRRLAASVAFSGVIYAHQYRLTVRQLIVELEFIAKVADPEDFLNRVEFLPLK